jgi:hypothetical protein
MPCYLNLLHAMHSTVYCMPGSPWCGPLFTSFVMHQVPLQYHVVQLNLLKCSLIFPCGFCLCQVENVVLAFRPRGVGQLLYPCQVSGPRPLKICARGKRGFSLFGSGEWDSYSHLSGLWPSAFKTLCPFSFRCHSSQVQLHRGNPSALDSRVELRGEIGRLPSLPHTGCLVRGRCP